MKRLVSLIAACAGLTVLMSFIAMKKVEKNDGQGHSLSSLWREYDSAYKNDRPQKSAEILESIKKHAYEKRLSWDYYDACRKYVDVKSSRNWKLRRELQSGFKEDVRRYGDPLLTFLCAVDFPEAKADSLVRFAVENAEILKKNVSSAVYKARPPFRGELQAFADALVPSLRNDYEYVLWAVCGQWGLSGNAFGQVCTLLDMELEGRYPEAAFAEYVRCVKIDEEDRRETALRDLAQKFEGKAAALVPVQDLMKSKFSSMEGKATSVDYVNFRAVLESYEKERGMFRFGTEKAIADACTVFGGLIAGLERESAAVNLGDGKIVLQLRNIDALEVCLLRRDDSEEVFRTHVDNPVKSFYVYDTLTVGLPVMDDGKYRVECWRKGEVMPGRVRYEKYSISLASRNDADGMRVYAADSRTGRPVDKADFCLYKGDRQVAEARNVPMDGFTPLPENISAVWAESGSSALRLMCSCRDGESGRYRMSNMLYLHRNTSGYSAVKGRMAAEIFKDRSAYALDDTLRFKAVVYNCSESGNGDVAEEGTEVLARLVDSNGNVIGEKSLSANCFGSVAGSFSLSDIGRRGMCSIEILAGGRLIGSSYFRADEFVLPAFDLVFDEPDVLYFPGDTVKVSGRLVDFSGHSCSGARADVTVMSDGKKIVESPLDIAADGTFSLSFAAGRRDVSYCSYTVEIKVVDVTGQTLEFTHHNSLTAFPSLRVNLGNRAEGSFTLGDDGFRNGRHYHDGAILEDDVALLECSVENSNGRVLPFPLEYELMKGGEKISGGKVMSGETVPVDFSGLAQGTYEFVLALPEHEKRGAGKRHYVSYGILKIGHGDVSLETHVESFFHVLDDAGNVSVEFGCGDGPLWAVVELFGDKARLLDSRLVSADGDGSCVMSVNYDYKAEYPDGVRLNVMYFKNEKMYEYTHVWERPAVVEEIPLEFVHFTDRALPGTGCLVKVRTSPEAEVLASVFDLGTEKIMPNIWEKIRLHNVAVEAVDMYSALGRDRASGAFYAENGTGVHIRGAKSRVMYDVCEEEAVPFQLGGLPSMAGKADMGFVNDIPVREDFSSTLTFEPFLRPSEDGIAEFRFRAGDRISTYAVSVYVHDKSAGSAAIRRNMLVSRPVKVAVAEPQYLYQGDSYVLRASVSNDSASEVSGKIWLYVYDGETHEGAEPLFVRSEDVTVPSYGSAGCRFAIEVPEASALGFKVMFAGESGFGQQEGNAAVSDGLFVSVPVYAADQTLAEAHSAVLLPDMSSGELEGRLRSRFVNVSDAGAEYSEILLMDLLHNALENGQAKSGKDVISLSEALYVNMLAYGLDRKADLRAEWPELTEKILACANADGGFGWFEGMVSSPVVTAVVLDRYASLRDRGLLAVIPELLGEDAADELDEAVVRAVRYLDTDFFSVSDRPLWCGSLSLVQYLYIRSFYSGISLDLPSGHGTAEDCLQSFTKEAKNWLTGSDAPGGNSDILGKVRRIRVIMNLNASEQGHRLAQKLGISSRLLKKACRTLDNDIVSLAEYAVEHASGGMYYPNAVMPWRGLLQSEAYAHSAICDLLRDVAASGKDEDGRLSRIADGIRLWIMVQKESQHWNGDPGFVEAIASVYDGSPEVKGAKIVILKKKYRKPFAEIKPAGNGFRVSAEYYRADGSGDSGMVRINDGDSVHVGEKIVARYSVWNEENRSFVLLTVPRPACLRPQDQLSGRSGGWMRPLSAGRFRISPSSYREVLKDRTLYWVDMFPEENTEIEETFFVVQEGVFQSAASEIESLYASHYRANGMCRSLTAAM